MLVKCTFTRMYGTKLRMECKLICHKYVVNQYVILINFLSNFLGEDTSDANR
jgi:hypothetical protein